jgi:hypothetical protein
VWAAQGQCSHAEAAQPTAAWCRFGDGRREWTSDGKSREREKIRQKGAVPLLFAGPKP